ncbi:MAG: D-glycero-beta-D-manno-heptose 1,7-bisphosphate 7-phosphatase [Sedimenticola sp.]
MSSPSENKPRALFLDRDGVVNVDNDYIFRQEDFHFMEGIFEVCHTAQNLGYLLVIITNQSGIARGYYTEDDFNQLTEWMLGQFQSRGIGIARVYFCPHHPTLGTLRYRKSCRCRKPNPGMPLQAMEELDIDMQNSLLIGDKARDIRAGSSAGIGTNILLDPTADEASPAEADLVIGSLSEFVPWLHNHTGTSEHKGSTST